MKLMLSKGMLLKHMFSKVIVFSISQYIWICLLHVYFDCVDSCTINTYNTTSGILYSINYPEDYPNNLNCITVIEIPNAFYIEISFDKLHTESIADLNLKGDLCNLDYVELKVNGSVHKLCGNWNRKEHFLYFKFQTERVEIMFVSDDQKTTDGFVIKWDAIQIDVNSTGSCSPAHIDTVDSCFEIVSKPESWDDGNHICKSKGAFLARIDSYETHTAIQEQLIARKFESEAFWIGASDRLYEGDFRWPDRSAVPFQNWFPGWSQLNSSSRQPSDDGFSNEDCVEMRRQFSFPDKGRGVTDSYFWNDRNCNITNPFICQHLKQPDKVSTSYSPVDCDVFYNLTEDQPTITVTSPGYPQHYTELTSCHMIVIAPFGKQVVVEFSNFRLEDEARCEFDNITLSTFPATKGITHCGNWNEKLKKLRWTSDDNTLLLSFITDHNKNYSGFKAKIGYVDNNHKCSPSLTNGTSSDRASGEWVYGPGGCWRYLNHTAEAELVGSSCEAIDSLIPNAIVDGQAIFVLNLLEYSQYQRNEQCITFWIGLTEDENFTSSENRTDCLAQTLCVHDSRTSLHVQYNSSVRQVPCSEKLNILCLRRVSAPETDHHESLVTEPEGEIFSPGFANKTYDNNYHHTYVFTAPPNHSVFFTVKYLDLEYQTQCLYDALKMFGITNNTTLCGKLENVQRFMSTSNNSSLVFNTDDSVSSGGFHISWFWINKTLPIFYHEESDVSGIITNLNFPNSFPEPTKGCSSISAPMKHRVLVEFKEINIPGVECSDAKIELITGGRVLKLFCGNKVKMNEMAFFDWIVLSSNNSLDICVDLPPLGNKEGFRASFRFVPNQARIESVVWLAPNDTRPINSLMYPLNVPGNTFHETTVETAIGYTVTLKNIEVDFPEGISCTENHLQIIDQSFDNDSAEILEEFTCDNTSDTTKAKDNQIIIELRTYLNVMKLQLRSAGDNNNNETIKFKAALVSEIDPDYLNKTMYDRGSFKRCENTTCGNYGNCTAVGHDRFTCTCHPQYAGLFCQTTKCGLKPCIHGNCSLISTGFKCGCEKGWWGSRCNMDDFVCQYKQCSGHGKCVEIPEKENISCSCHQGWSGSRCEIAIPETPEQLTIGQKLLKEPIWIGMIVMLNLVLFFCVSYVARRKCGKRIAKLMPKRKKPTDNTSKEGSHSKEETSTTARDIYSLQIELPRSETSSKSPSSINPTKFLFEKVDTSAPPTPVLVKEQKKEVALRFFEAYKSNNPDNRLSQSFDLSAGIQDGTVSFLDGNDDTEKKDSSPAMIRSYTISSLEHGPSVAKKRWKNLLRQTRSLPGSPEELRTSLERKQNKEDIEKSSKPVGAEHCYPIIRILNENNHEEHHNSDSDNSVISPESKRDTKTLINATSDSQVNYVRHGDSADSGYPTTSVSSQNTQFGGISKSEQIKSQSAGERRKLFGNKAKSKSFYDISYGEGRLSADTSSFSTDLDYESRAHDMRRSLSRELGSSFDSGHYCLMCRRDRKLDHAESYSCESELNRLHMSDRTYSSDSRLSRKCNCRKCRHRGRSHCRKHIRQFSKDINSLNTSINHRYSEGNVKRSRHRGHRRSSERPTVCNSAECTVAHSRSFRDYSNAKISTSTESEACDCSKSKVRSRRKCYKRIEHYSAGSCAPRSRRPNLSSIANSAASWEQSKDEVYKRKMMDSYLSNVRSTGYSFQDKYLSVDGLEHFDPSWHNSGSHLSTDSYQSKHNSFGSSKSHSPMADISEQLSRNRPSHLPDVEVVSQNLNNEPEYQTRSVDKLETTPLSMSSSGSDGTSKGFKDSAYQTKQSSMDRFNSIKDRNTTTKTNNKQPDSSNRNDDRVRRHLHQAAQKLAMIKYFRSAQEQLSKDSAICTFSEDDLSTDDPDPRSLRPLVKRTSGLAFQMKEMNLSEVKEECSGVSHGSYVNTPNNEPSMEQPDKHRDESRVLIPLSSLCKSASQPDISYLDETKV